MSANKVEQIELRLGYEPGVIGRIGELHGRFYASAWNASWPFEILLLRELCEMMERYDAARDLLVTAWINDTLIGSTAVRGGVGAAEWAQLRFVIVDTQWQGRGAGKAMLNAALKWSREQNFRKIFLWTVEGLPASRWMYEAAGFRVVERLNDDRYTVPRENLRMELSLE